MILPVAIRRQARHKGPPTPSTCAPCRTSPRRVLIVAVPTVRTLDLFGPAEVFGDANFLHGGDLAYEVKIIFVGTGSRCAKSHGHTAEYFAISTWYGLQHHAANGQGVAKRNRE